jgi:peptidoglycan hydrolase CwlO-like protein
VALINEME